MNKFYILIFLFFLAINSNAQNSIVFNSKFNPDKTYKTKLKTSSETEMDIIANQEIIDKIKSKGVQFPIVSKSETEMSVDIITYHRKKNGEFPAKMIYGKVIKTETQDDKTKREEMPYSGMIIMGKYNVENKFKLESIKGSQVSEEMKRILKETLENVQQQIKFPEKPLKIGDIFTTEIPMTIPLEDKGAIYVKINVEYLLESISGDLAIFQIKQTVGLDMQQEQINITASGSGNGISEYNIKESYLTKYSSEIPMNMTMKIAENITMKMKMLIVSEQEVSIE